MAKVLWQRLILRGFGCYRGEYEIELSDYSVLVLANESGKSTLVAGLAAVVFGLPATSDPTKFGQARYRNWDDPPEFSGELHFAVDATQYQLTRNFATHQVSLRYLAQGQWVQLPQATGIDNPSATRPFRAYQETLQDLLGISSLDLFLATFCITQPLPTPEGLDEAVQGLLAGAGGKATRVQQLLEAGLKQITRFYGEPLGRSRGGNKDRQLQVLQAEISELKQQMEIGQAGSDELQVIQSRLAELTAERLTQQNLLTARTSTLQAWSEWRTQAERYQHGLEQQQQMQQVLYRAHQLEEQAQAVRSQLVPFNFFAENTLDWGPYLEQQLEQERQLVRIQRELEELKTELSQLQTNEEQTLRNYRQREQELLVAAEQAQQRYAALVTQDEAYSELEQDYQARYGDLNMGPAELLAATQQQTLERRAGRRRQQAPASGAGLAWASRLGSMLLAGVVYWFWGRLQGEALGIGVSLVCALLGWLLPLLSKSSKSATGKDATSIALSRFSDLPAAQSFLTDLLAAQATRPTTAALTAAQTQLAQAQAELAGCQGMVTAFTSLETSGRRNIEHRLATQQAQIDDIKAQLTAATAAVAAFGVTTPVDWTALKQQYSAYVQLQQRLHDVRQAQNALCSAQQVADLASLERRALDLQNNLAAIRLAWQTLIDNNPGLPAIAGTGELGDTRRGAPHVRPSPQEQHGQLKTEIAALQQELTALQREEENLLRRRAQLEGQKPLNLAVAYERLQELERQEQRLILEVDALGLAYRQLEAARVDYSASHRQRLADQASDYFRLITGQHQRSVELDTEFAVTLYGAVGQPIHPAQLSQGARDQLYLSLRLAIADLLVEDVRLPLILDDPFVNCDSERLKRIRQALARIAATRQIWLLTHNPQFADWVANAE